MRGSWISLYMAQKASRGLKKHLMASQSMRYNLVNTTCRYTHNLVMYFVDIRPFQKLVYDFWFYFLVRTHNNSRYDASLTYILSIHHQLLRNYEVFVSFFLCIEI
jgi:hypothetical protein